MKKRYYLFRHGETFVTKSQGRHFLYGLRHFSAQLLPDGLPVIKDLGIYLHDKSIDYAVTSEYLRCRDTAAIVAKYTKKDFIGDKRLNSFFLETPWHFRKRLQKFLTAMENSDYQSIVICTHGLVLSMLVGLLTKKNFSFKEIFSPPPPGTLLIIEDGQLQIINFKDHFAPPKL